MDRTLQRENFEVVGERRFFTDRKAMLPDFLRAVTIVISDIHNLPVTSSKSPLTLSFPVREAPAFVRYHFLEIM
jgi:hypothetical protein